MEASGLYFTIWLVDRHIIVYLVFCPGARHKPRPGDISHDKLDFNHKWKRFLRLLKSPFDILNPLTIGYKLKSNALPSYKAHLGLPDRGDAF